MRKIRVHRVSLREIQTAGNVQKLCVHRRQSKRYTNSGNCAEAKCSSASV